MGSTLASPPLEGFVSWIDGPGPTLIVGCTPPRPQASTARLPSGAGGASAPRCADGIIEPSGHRPVVAGGIDAKGGSHDARTDRDPRLARRGGGPVRKRQ